MIDLIGLQLDTDLVFFSATPIDAVLYRIRRRKEETA